MSGIALMLLGSLAPDGAWAYEWNRPLGFFALLLPLLVWLLSMLPGRPRPLAVGTLELWREVAQETEAGAARNRRHVPPARWLLIVGMILAAIALAAPRPERAPELASWRLVLDRSPSMGLEFIDAQGLAAGHSRLHEAVRQAHDWVAAAREQEGRARILEWLTPTSAGLARFVGEEPPEDWLRPALRPQEAPTWGAFDVSGTLWLTDRAPARKPVAAGILAIGGAAVFGPVAVQGARLLHWDGSELRLAEASEQLLGLALDEGLPARLTQIARLWAASRGLTVGVDALNAALHIEHVPAEGPGVASLAGRDGWQARLSAPASGLQAIGMQQPLSVLAQDAQAHACSAWLLDSERGARRTLIAWQPGRVRSVLRSLEEPVGDPASFAVSFGELFDAALLPPAEVIALAEREHAFPAVIRAPLDVGADSAARDAERWPLIAILSLAATLLAGAFTLLRK